MSGCRSCSGRLFQSVGPEGGKTAVTELVAWSLDQARSIVSGFPCRVYIRCRDVLLCYDSSAISDVFQCSIRWSCHRLCHVSTTESNTSSVSAVNFSRCSMLPPDSFLFSVSVMWVRHNDALKPSLSAVSRTRRFPAGCARLPMPARRHFNTFCTSSEKPHYTDNK